MSDQPPPAPRRPSGRRRRTAPKAWAAFLLLLAALAGFTVLVDRHRRSEQAGWSAAREKLYQLKGSIDAWRRPTYESIAARFKPSERPATRPHFEGVTFRATFDGRAFGPQYEGWTVEMTFVDRPGTSTAPDAFLYDRHTHGRLLYLTARPPRTYQSTPAVLWYHVQTGRRVAIAIAGVGWIAAAMLMSVAGAWRPAIAQVCVAAAMVAATAWLLDPAYAWDRWTDDRALKLIGAALAFGLLMTALPPRVRRRDHGHCAVCKYDLTGNESGVCPECGTMTPAFLEGRRHAESARIAEPLESGSLTHGPEPEGFVVWDDREDAGDADDTDGTRPQGEPVPDSVTEPAVGFRTGGTELSATGPP